MVKIKEGLKGDGLEDWTTFGEKFMINLRFLAKNILLIKYQTYSMIPWLKRREINEAFTYFLQELIDTQTINYGLLKQCNKEDIELFEKIIDKGKLIKTLNYDKRKREVSDDDLKEQLRILQGEIEAGNDNEDIPIKCKEIILKLFERNLITEEVKNELINDIDDN